MYAPVFISDRSTKVTVPVASVVPVSVPNSWAGVPLLFTDANVITTFGTGSPVVASVARTTTGGVMIWFTVTSAG